MSKSMRTRLTSVIAVCILATGSSAFAVSGKVTSSTGAPVAYTYVGMMDGSYNVLGSAVTDTNGNFSINATTASGYLFVQPYAPMNAQGLGIYPNEPRNYIYDGEATVSLVLPAAGCIVLQGYDANGNLMRWGNFLANGVTSGQFVFATNTNDEVIESSPWPVYDPVARAQGCAWNMGLPALVVPTGQTTVVNVMYWKVPGYGKLMLKADNNGAGYSLSQAGAVKVLSLNVELASTAVNDLNRRKASLPASGASSITSLNTQLAAAKTLTNAVQQAAAADKVLASALQLRDSLEFQAAQSAVNATRQGSLTVVVKNSLKQAVSNCKVAIVQQTHSFKFGMFDGNQFNKTTYQAGRDAGFEMASLLFGWGWLETSPGVLLSPSIIDSYYGITQMKNMGFMLKGHGIVWNQTCVLPPRTYTMNWSDVQTQALTFQTNIINAFKSQIGLWEAMNESPESNALDTTRPNMNALLASAAGNLKALAGAASLVNAPHEIDFGAKYLYWNLSNQPSNSFPLTYYTFLTQAKAAGQLANIGTVGLQLYPGYKLNAADGALEGPAMTPSWLVDTLTRYATFNLPIQITEFSLPSSYGAGWNNGYWREPWTQTTQADYAERVYTLVFANAKVGAITWWDMLDSTSSVQTGGLIDTSGAKKAAYTRIQGLIKSWTTNAQGTTNSSGSTTIIGFGGTYNVTVTQSNGKVTTTTATITERGATTLNITAK